MRINPGLSDEIEFHLQKGTATQSSNSAVDQLYERLRGRIIHGEIAAGAKFSEAELCRVSRRANAGARAVELNVEELLEIYQVREALEGMACRLAAERMSDAAIDEVRGLLQAHMENSDLQAGRAYYQKEGDLDFHYRLVQASQNSKLIHLLCDELYTKVRMYRYQFGMVSPRAVDAYAEHQHIVQAIADRDGEMAEMLMRRINYPSQERIQDV